MTEVTFYFNTDHKIVGFDCVGHAGFKRAGKDVVCAGISTLTINTVNTITDLLKADAKVKTDDKAGLISIRLNSTPDDKTELVFKSYEMGIRNISEEYGSKYCKVTGKED